MRKLLKHKFVIYFKSLLVIADLLTSQWIHPSDLDPIGRTHNFGNVQLRRGLGTVPPKNHCDEMIDSRTYFEDNDSMNKCIVINEVRKQNSI